MEKYSVLLGVPFLLAFISTVLITPLVIFLARKFGLVDDPKRSNHPGIVHTRPLPRGGGIALFLGVIIPSIIFIPVNNVTLSLFIAALLALIIGVIDDALNAQSKDVSPYLRILINLLCGVIVVASGVTLDFVTNPFGGIIHFNSFSFVIFGSVSVVLSDVLTLMWIVWVMNMLNWSKGVDGQMPGIVAIAAIVMGILSLRFFAGDPAVIVEAQLSFIIAGAALGFLIYNFYPAKILPGYGATSIYLLLAVISIMSGAKLATAILVMGVPTVDALFTIMRRLASRRSVFRGDKQHLHHLLLETGMSQRKIALFYWSISAILGLIALHLQSRSKIFAILMLLVIVGGGIFFLHTILQQRNEKTTS